MKSSVSVKWEISRFEVVKMSPMSANYAAIYLEYSAMTIWLWRRAA